MNAEISPDMLKRMADAALENEQLREVNAELLAALQACSNFIADDASEGADEHELKLLGLASEAIAKANGLVV